MIWTVDQEVGVNEVSSDRLDRFAEAIDQDSRALGAACGVNVEENTISAIFSVAADDSTSASAIAGEIVARALEAAGLRVALDSPKRFSIELERP
jgi:hypothetical protein